MTGVSREDFRHLDDQVGNISNDVSSVKTEVKNLKEVINQLVHKHEFFPVKMIAYGLAVGAGTAVVTAIISKVVS